MEFYSKKPYFSHAMLAIISSAAVCGKYFFVPLIFVVMLYLLTEWSIRINILLRFDRVSLETATHVLYSKLCLIRRGECLSFELDNTFYKIKRGKDNSDDYAISKVTAPIAQPLRLFPIDSFISAEDSRFFRNSYDVTPPAFLDLMREHAVQPFFVWQVASSLLWMLDDYPIHALIGLVMIVLFELSVVFQRIKNMKQFRTIQFKGFNVSVEGAGVLHTSLLKPGMVVNLPDEELLIPADMLIVDGIAVVNESNLTGESCSIKKSSAPKTDELLCLDQHKRFILFSGTRLLKGPVKGFILQTGAHTEQGKLVHKMSVIDRVNICNREVYYYLGILFFVGLISAAYVLYVKTMSAIVDALLIISNVIPPELPMELTVAVNNSLLAMLRKGVYCLEPFKVPIAGNIDTVCFDKTGTLTIDSYTVSEQLNVTDEASFAVGIAHNNYCVLNKGKILGDPIEQALIDFFKVDISSLSQLVKIYEFQSQLRRMTTVRQHKGNYFVSMKGAPEKVNEFVKNPSNIFEEYAAKGYRILAYASKSIKSCSGGRSLLESDLTLNGYLLFSSKLRNDAKVVVDTLKGANYDVVMITGDNALTAKNIGDGLGISKIYSQANPSMKEEIIKNLQDKGKKVMMVGDGSNDVSALKQADVGIAIIDGKSTGDEENVALSTLGNATVAAHFTGRNGLTSVLTVLLQGQSTLVTTLQMYKILALNSLISAWSLAVLDIQGIKYGDTQMSICGIALVFAFLFLTKSGIGRLTKKKVTGKIFSYYLWCSVIIQSTVHIIALVYVNSLFEPVFMEKFAPNQTNTALFLISIVQQNTTFVSNYIGEPFRESFMQNTPLFASVAGIYALIIYILYNPTTEIGALMEVVDLGAAKRDILATIIIDGVFCVMAEKISYYFFNI